RSHIGEQDAAFFDHRVAGLTEVGAHPAACGLSRRPEALAGHVEQPAVKSAAQSAILEPSEGEVGAAVRTGALDQAVVAPVVPEQHEILAEEPYRFDRSIAGEFINQRGGLPIAAQELAGGPPPARGGHEVVLLGAQPGGGPCILAPLSARPACDPS